MATGYRRLRRWGGPEPPRAGPEHDAPPPGGTSGPAPAQEPIPGPKPRRTFFDLVSEAMEDNPRAVRFCCIAIVLALCLFGGIALVALAIKGIHLHLPAFSARGQSYASLISFIFGGSGLTVFVVVRLKKIIKRRDPATNGEDRTTIR